MSTALFLISVISLIFLTNINADDVEIVVIETEDPQLPQYSPYKPQNNFQFQQTGFNQPKRPNYGNNYETQTIEISDITKLIDSVLQPVPNQNHQYLNQHNIRYGLPSNYPERYQPNNKPNNYYPSNQPGYPGNYPIYPSYPNQFPGKPPGYNPNQQQHHHHHHHHHHPYNPYEPNNKNPKPEYPGFDTDPPKPTLKPNKPEYPGFDTEPPKPTSRPNKPVYPGFDTVPPKTTSKPNQPEFPGYDPDKDLSGYDNPDLFKPPTPRPTQKPSTTSKPKPGLDYDIDIRFGNNENNTSSEKPSTTTKDLDAFVFPTETAERKKRAVEDDVDEEADVEVLDRFGSNGFGFFNKIFRPNNGNKCPPGSFRCEPPIDLNACGIKSDQNQPIKAAVIGGTPLRTASSAPWMVAIGEYDQDGEISWFCGGSLISPYLILTAAHCVTEKSADVARLGELDFNRFDEDAGPVEINIETSAPHPDYKKPSFYNDLAIVRLRRPVQYSRYIRAICLPSFSGETDENFTSEMATLIGWGQNSFGGSRSDVLMEVSVRVFNNSWCNHLYGNIESIKTNYPNGVISSQLCAGHPKGGRDACQGDSGGPLIIRDNNNIHKLIGVVSSGIGCGAKKYPGVYTRVSHFIDWIEKFKNFRPF